MQQYLISLLIFTPLLAAFVGLFLSSGAPKVFKLISVAVSLLQLIWMILILNQYIPSAGGMQFVEKQNWITLNLGSWGILKAEYFVGLDGLNLPLVALTVLIMMIATISSWTIEKNVKGYFILLLILNAAVI